MPQDHIPDFTQVAPSIWEHIPSPSETLPKSLDTPSLILLCTWTGAQHRYITKYTDEYRLRFPSTRIIVITTTTKDLCFRNSARKQARCKPAVELIQSYKYLLADSMYNGILLHVFSEGGSNKACELADAYLATTHERLPVSALLLDSTPGHPRYLRLCNALNKSLPRVPVLRHTGLVFGSAVLGAIWVSYRFVKGRNNNVITRTRRRLNDGTLFHTAAPRCYLYSEEDALIAAEDVHEHAVESAEAGIPVAEVLFEGSGHVEHAKRSPERYWEAVNETWTRATEGRYWAKSPSLEIVVEECDASDEEVDECKKKRWSCADSERTLLPGCEGSAIGVAI